MIEREPFEPDTGELSFLLMSNILDLASAAGNCAEAMREAGVPEARAMAQADAFVHGVKRLPTHLTDIDGRAYSTDLMSLEDWRLRHAQALEIGRYLRVGLWELPEAERGAPAEHLARLAERIADGERLAA